jgi:hypothetical protein
MATVTGYPALVYELVPVIPVMTQAPVQACTKQLYKRKAQISILLLRMRPGYHIELKRFQAWTSQLLSIIVAEKLITDKVREKKMLKPQHFSAAEILVVPTFPNAVNALKNSHFLKIKVSKSSST